MLKLTYIAEANELASPYISISFQHCLTDYLTPELQLHLLLLSPWTPASLSVVYQISTEEMDKIFSIALGYCFFKRCLLEH